MNDAHSYYLDELVNNIHRLPFDKDIHYVFREPNIYRLNHNIVSMCDLIIGFYDGTASAVELKGNRVKKPKAIKQINNGRWFIQEVLNKKYNNGLFVVYKHGDYLFEII